MAYTGVVTDLLAGPTEAVDTPAGRSIIPVDWLDDLDEIDEELGLLELILLDDWDDVLLEVLTELEELGLLVLIELDEL